jgi:HlyD family secretion protein
MNTNFEKATFSVGHLHSSRGLTMSVAMGLALGAAVGLAACGNGDDPGALFASGTVEATEADLGFQVPGRVEAIDVREGDRVSGGQTLAWLDASELEAARNAAAAQVTAAEAQLRAMTQGARPQELAQAEAAVRAAEQRAADAARDAERAQRLFDGGAVSQQGLDRALTAREVVDAARDQATEALAMVREGPRQETIAAQSAMVAQARANLARTEATLANASITAPFPGVVTVRHREPGEAVGPGAPVVTILDPDDRWVRIYVREDQIGRVQIGMSANITSDTYPDETHSGEVVFIGSEAEFTPRNVQTAEERIKLVYPVKVRITSDGAFHLKPGIPADVTLLEPGA